MIGKWVGHTNDWIVDGSFRRLGSRWDILVIRAILLIGKWMGHLGDLKVGGSFW